jgi:hypothetical protein
MLRCFPHVSAIILAGFFMFQVYAQTISLTGMVKDSGTQQGVGNALVKVMGLNDSTFTDSNGIYSFTTLSIGSFLPAGTRSMAVPRLTQNALFFSVSDNAAQVHINIYDFSGRQIGSLVDRILGPGNYRVSPYSPAMSSQVYLVKIRTGDRVAVLKMPCFGKPLPLSGGSLRKINDASGKSADGSGMGKSRAINDTIAVFASGYLIGRKPVTRYAGTENFSLVWSGLGGSIMFENASYQGCQYPAYVSVLDSSVRGASLTVHVKSTTSPAGFAFPLRRVAGSAGVYADSLYFSIAKTDSAKHVLRVGDMDSVFAWYDHGTPSHPAALRTTNTAWSGTTGQIGPGASQYFGLRAKMLINLFDGDLTDSVAFVTVKSPKDTSGISLGLKALPGNPGSFSREIGFSLAASIQDSVIAVDGRDSMGQLITMIYHDVTPATTQFGSICTWIPEAGTLLLDSTAYHGTGGTMGITLIDDDILDSIAVVTVKSTRDAAGIKDTLKASAGHTGQFLGSVGFSTTTSTARVIAVSNGDSITVTYQDDTPTKAIVSRASWNAN